MRTYRHHHSLHANELHGERVAQLDDRLVQVADMIVHLVVPQNCL